MTWSTAYEATRLRAKMGTWAACGACIRFGSSARQCRGIVVALAAGCAPPCKKFKLWLLNFSAKV